MDLDAARARLASVMDESDELAGQVSRNASEVSGMNQKMRHRAVLILLVLTHAEMTFIMTGRYKR